MASSGASMRIAHRANERYRITMVDLKFLSLIENLESEINAMGRIGRGLDRSFLFYLRCGKLGCIRIARCRRIAGRVFHIRIFISIERGRCAFRFLSTRISRDSFNTRNLSGIARNRNSFNRRSSFCHHSGLVDKGLSRLARLSLNIFCERNAWSAEREGN